LSFAFADSPQGGGEAGTPLSAKAERRLRTTVREMTPPNWGQSLTACMKELSRYLNGWVAHFRLCTEEATRALRAVDAHIRRRLRAIISLHRKRPRFLFRHLRSRGASIKAAAEAAFSGRGRWFCPNHPGLRRAYPLAWFSGKLVSLATRWDELNVQASGQLLLLL
jgi:RNA-directed DNA polymerase